jgi:hypothetical protein
MQIEDYKILDSKKLNLNYTCIIAKSTIGVVIMSKRVVQPSPSKNEEVNESTEVESVVKPLEKEKLE